jgi:hypothetical protein
MPRLHTAGRRSRNIGIAIGAVATHELFHIGDAVAFSLKASTMAERLGSVAVAVAILVVLCVVVYRLFSRSFLHGFIVASGLVFSVDIVLLHWIFQLHRITSGPEADVLEPIFVIVGAAMAAIGIRRENAAARKAA